MRALIFISGIILFTEGMNMKNDFFCGILEFFEEIELRIEFKILQKKIQFID